MILRGNYFVQAGATRDESVLALMRQCQLQRLILRVFDYLL
jgi:hypothetical protein